jgi:sugar fermentation stimulation protein A
MKFTHPLARGTLVQRYKRFLADVQLDDGRIVTAHCPNTGSMMGCATPGSSVWLSPSPGEKRKLAWTWELVEAAPGVIVGIHTGRTNGLVRAAIESGVLAEARGYPSIRAEAKYGNEGSRVDFLLERAGGPACYVEVKNVTAAVRDGIALFPDAVSMRGTKHLREMSQMVRDGHRALLVFCVQRGDVTEVHPADAIDPEYGATLRRALAAGVEAVAYRADVSPQEIHLVHRLPVVCP